jgi:uncharacterized membrane protein
MLSKVETSETQIRSITKVAIYRVFSICVSVALALYFGGTMTQAALMGAATLINGSIHYYLYERLWLRIKWGRSAEGVDSKLRSFVKAFIYRCTVIIVISITARLIFVDSTVTAFVIGLIKFGVNMITYLGLERIFNSISWGKIKTEETK